MSRIGKKPVPVPANVKVAISGRSVSITGPKGTLVFEHHPLVKVTWTESEKSIVCSVADAADRVAKAQWGTTRAILRNMIEGVSNGYEKTLEVNGVGWAPSMQGTKLKLVVGLASPIFLEIPKGINVVVDKQIIRVSGADRQMVGEFAARVRSQRKPEPYNGKGIKYTTETIRRKQGKQFGA
ncbi:MAG: 50S ribosomal protein L6 [Phycisphaeraceae bacterium]|nr:50S ribosomal protein L6 [Phycisphaeraceae bacterium]MBX3367199.1 50S ribosomal protein L6 [Phycisphaeraceae bacterium]QYK49451.1 MAG: 50S ribosomal protein L6 [Phycisphaeraceae bacterium]